MLTTFLVTTSNAWASKFTTFSNRHAGVKILKSFKPDWRSRNMCFYGMLKADDWLEDVVDRLLEQFFALKSYFQSELVSQRNGHEWPHSAHLQSSGEQSIIGKNAFSAVIHPTSQASRSCCKLSLSSFTFFMMKSRFLSWAYFEDLSSRTSLAARKVQNSFQLIWTRLKISWIVPISDTKRCKILHICDPTGKISELMHLQFFERAKDFFKQAVCQLLKTLLLKTSCFETCKCCIQFQENPIRLW